MIDPVCIFHGKKKSEHDCLYCCLCFETITPEQCNVLPDGLRENVCKICAEAEKDFRKKVENKCLTDSWEFANILA